MGHVSDILEGKGSDVLGIEASATVYEAVAKMVEGNVGALLVYEAGTLAGIVTERDVLRAVATGSVDGPVSEAMTHSPETVGPDESAGHAAALMIHGGFRHLPVVDGGDVVGMVSIRDLVRVSVDDEAPRGV